MGRESLNVKVNIRKKHKVKVALPGLQVRYRTELSVTSSHGRQETRQNIWRPRTLTLCTSATTNSDLALPLTVENTATQSQTRQHNDSFITAVQTGSLSQPLTIASHLRRCKYKTRLKNTCRKIQCQSCTQPAPSKPSEHLNSELSCHLNSSSMTHLCSISMSCMRENLRDNQDAHHDSLHIINQCHQW